MLLLIIFILLILFLVLVIKTGLTMKKNKDLFFKNNPKFKSGKVFSLMGLLKVYVCEDGDIAAIFDKGGNQYSILNIKDIRDWDIIQDGNSSKKLGGAVAGGLLFGGIGLITGAILGGKKQYISNLTLVLKTNNFNNPNVELVFINTKTSIKDAKFYLNQLQDLTSTLEILAENNKINNNTAEAV
ncbi:MAG: hypothetical protein ACRDDY_14220 [Clostridium sp.]|uniref:hypothetical protein n=1 Tax=Bacteria TaxID=2 RepID=UPI003EE62851